MVGAYGLTTGSGIVEALIRAKQRGIDVRLIADKTIPCERNSVVEPAGCGGGADLDRRPKSHRARQDNGH